METMNSTDSPFVAFLGPFGGILDQLAHTPSFLASGIGLLVVCLFFWSNGNKATCFDQDGVPMKELTVSSMVAVLFKPEISEQGEKLAMDEPYIIRDRQHRQVVLHTAEHVRELLRNDAKDHFRPENLSFGDYFYRVLGQCVGALSGDQWRLVRSYFDPAYTHNAGLAMLPSFQRDVSRWLNTLKSDSLRTGVGRLVVHMPTSAKLLTLRVIPRSFYGEAYDDEAFKELERISQLQAQALGYAATGQLRKYRWYNTLPTSSRRHLDLYHRDWEAFNIEILDKARQGKLKIPAEHAFTGVQPDTVVSMDRYIQTVDEMLFTNIDLTGGILTFMLSHLAKHQDFQQRLYEEIMAQKRENELDLRNYVTRQTSLLHYLTLESIRLRPATWFSVAECTTVDKVIGKYKIPARTPFVIDVRRLNTNPLTWGPDGAEFRPERFASLAPSEYRYGYMRFGLSGKCLGKHMADVLMKVAMISVLEKYRVEEVEMNIGVREGDLAFIHRRH